MVDGFALPFDVPRATLERAVGIKLVLFDVDGVLTDGSLYLDNTGEEYKAFNSRDGHGIKMLQRNGVEIGIITGRTSRIVEHRTAELGVRHVCQGCADKLAAFETLIDRLGLESAQAAYAGDDVVDLPVMLRAGLAIAVQDAHSLVKQYAHWITPSAGGRGAARELCELIMAAQGSYAVEMQRYF
ncbi:MAG: 3-deoxy-manno-octulosonate-8-phosphatase KdsC [Acidiferrobacterales bacterium]